MPEMKEYKPGTPTWVDLGAKDLKGAIEFYTELFGWDPLDMGPDAGNYTMMQLKGKMVAAVSPLMSEEQPVAWSTYLATDDVDATAAKVKEAGGTVIAEPFDVMTAGRMAVFMDPTGAAVLAWQAKEHHGAELVNEPNTLVWNELQTRDTTKAEAFYKDAFGLGAKAFGPGGEYTLFTVEGREVAGMMSMGDVIPKEVPPHWLPYFAVEDTDATVDKVGKLGGKTLMPPGDFPGVGRLAVVADAQGAAFGVIKGPGSGS